MSAPSPRWTLPRLNPASSTATPFTLAAQAEVGDTLVAKITARDGAATVTAPDASWLGPLPAVPPRTATTSGGIVEWVFVKRVTSTIPAGTSFNFVGSTPRVRAGIMSCWQNLAPLPATAAEIVSAGQVNASGTPMPFPAITPYHTSGLLLTAGGAANSALSVTPDAGMTELGDGVTATGASDVLTFAAYKTLTGLTAAPTTPTVATLAAAGGSSAVTIFLPDTDATAINRPPTVSAGADQWVAAGTTVTLHGVGTDLDGNQLTYTWTQIKGPAVTLSSASATQPTFTAPRVNDVLGFQVVVSDGTVTSAPDTVTVTVKHAPFGLMKRPGGGVPIFT